MTQVWRLPVRYRLTLSAVLAVLPAFAVLLASTPWTGTEYLPAILTWPLVAASTTGWLTLAQRAWRVSAALDGAGLLVVRSMFRTRQVHAAELTGVRFRKQGSLQVLADRPASPAGARHAARSIVIPAIRLGAAYFTGRRTAADEAADTIAAAAGLPPLPPRREVIGPRLARIMLIRGIVVLGVAVAAGAGSQDLGGFAARAGRVLGQGLGYLGIVIIFPAALAMLDRSLDRWRGRAAGNDPPAQPLP